MKDYRKLLVPAVFAATSLTASQFTIDYASLLDGGQTSRTDVIPLDIPFAVDLGQGEELITEVSVTTTAVDSQFQNGDGHGLAILGGESDANFDSQEQIALSFAIHTTLGTPVTDLDIDLLGASARSADGDEISFSTGGDSASVAWPVGTGAAHTEGQLSAVPLSFSPLQVLGIEAGPLTGELNTEHLERAAEFREKVESMVDARNEWLSSLPRFLKRWMTPVVSAWNARMLALVEDIEAKAELLSLRQKTQLSAVTFQLSEAQAPNVIIFFMDDFGWPDVQADPELFPHGSPLHETPNMHRLANRGMRFTNAYAQPLCSPSRAALLSGQYSAARDFLYRAITNGSAIDPILPASSNSKDAYTFPQSINRMPYSVETIAERMKDAGYATWHAGKWHLTAGFRNPEYHDPYFPIAHGFDKQLGVGGSGPPNYFGPFDAIPSMVDAFGNPAHGTNKDYIADHYAKLVKELIADHRANDPETPFFLHYCPFSVHGPHQAKKSRYLYYKEKLETMPESKHQHPVFAAQVEGVDDELGSLLDYLDANNLNNNTMLFFLSDNGGLSFKGESGEVFDDIGPDGIADIPGDPNADGTYEVTTADVDPTTKLSNMAPLKGSKSNIYEGGVRVPMVVSYPRGGTLAGEVSTEAVHIVDIYSTILDYTPATAKEGYALDGESLKPALQENAELPERDIYIFFPRNLTTDGSGAPGGAGGTAVIKPPYKLHANYSRAHDQATEKYELYHIDDDMGEMYDLASQHPEIVDEMRKRLDEWYADIEAPVPNRNPNYDGFSKGDPEISKDDYYTNAGLILTDTVDTEDPDEDGRDNMTEFLQQTDPSVADAAAVTIWLYDNGAFTEIRFALPAAVAQSEFAIIAPDEELITLNSDLVLDGEYGNLFVYKMADPEPVTDVTGYEIIHSSLTVITPNPSSFSVAPTADSTNSISMEAVVASSAYAVEYYFAETTGNPGGDDSGWQSSASYTDTGLDAGTEYAYQVHVRNAVGAMTTASAALSAITDEEIIEGVDTIEYYFDSEDEIDELDLRGLSSIVIDGGILTATSTTNSPKFHVENFAIDGNSVYKLQMRLKASAAASLKFHFMTEQDPTYSAARFMTASYDTPGVSQTLEFDLLGHPQLVDDKLIDIRFTLPGTKGTVYEIDWVRLLITEPTFNFDVADDFDGWTLNNKIVASVQDGLMSAQFSGVAQVVRYGLTFHGEDVSRVLVRFKSPGSGDSANLRFATASNGSFDKTRLLFPSDRYDDGDGFEILEFDTTGHNQWVSNPVVGVRMNLPYISGETLDVDWVKFVNNPPVQLSSDDFEDGMGNWTAGGSSVLVTYENAIDTSALSIDNGAADAYAELGSVIDISGYYDVTLDFSYVENVVNAYESGEGFEVQIFNDGVWEMVDSFISGVNLGTAGERYDVSLIIDGLDPAESYQVRFVSVGSDSGDKVHLDNIEVSVRTD